MHELCVVFDVDDTLYLERDYVASGFRAVGEWVSKWLSIPDFESRCVGLFNSGRRGNIFDEALRLCDHEPASELLASLVAIYRSHLPRIEMLHDAARAIGEIRSCWPIAVITDGPVISQSRKCEALGLPGVAAQIVLTGMWGDKFHKPQTAAFELVASRIKAAKYVYVADNPAKDFTAPKQLGWYSVRIRRKGGLHYDKDNDSVMPDLGLPDCADLGTVLSYIASERRQWASI